MRSAGMMLFLSLVISAAWAQEPAPAGPAAVEGPPLPSTSRSTPSIPEMLAPPATPAKLDPTHPLRIGEEYYPPASRRAGEEGACLIRLQLDSDGFIHATQLVSSTGFERLNEACLSSTINGKLIPATAGGKPVASWFLLRVVWRLTGSLLALTPHIRDDYQLKVGPEYYPPISRKLHQEGDCIVRATVEQDGPPSAVTISKSAGYAPLDEACLSAVREAQFIAARPDGVRSQSSTDIDIVWRLPYP